MTIDDIITSNALVDDILGQFVQALGSNDERYRNHVYRCMNYQRTLLGVKTVPDEVAFAWALHDIGLFTSGWDYIGPSLQHIADLAPTYRIADFEKVQHMVQDHHKLRPCTDDRAETFRLADRIDVSRGLLRAGLSRRDVATTVTAVPYCGFHKMLVRSGLIGAARQPLRPLPMFRW